MTQFNMAKTKSDTLHVQGINVGIYTEDYQNEYISLTDIARFRNSEDPRFAIQNWMRNRNTIEFLGLWESLHNPNFNRVQFDTFRLESGLNRFVMTPSKWIETTGAIGITTKAGRYNGGTYAHSDIAYHFGMWLSPEFNLLVVKEFQRLKEEEQKAIGWSAKRELAKINYHIHTDAIKANLIPQEIDDFHRSMIYAEEADVLNVALFGVTAKEWRAANPDLKGNMRDYATINQLICLSNMENINAVFINEGMAQSDRLQKLNQIAIQQMTVLENVENKKILTK